VPSLLIPICFYELVEFAGPAAPVVGLVLTAGFKFCAVRVAVFPVARVVSVFVLLQRRV
jgi:hypothetical protein